MAGSKEQSRRAIPIDRIRYERRSHTRTIYLPGIQSNEPVATMYYDSSGNKRDVPSFFGDSITKHVFLDDLYLRCLPSSGFTVRRSLQTYGDAVFKDGNVSDRLYWDKRPKVIPDHEAIIVDAVMERGMPMRTASFTPKYFYEQGGSVSKRRKEQVAALLPLAVAVAFALLRADAIQQMPAITTTINNSGIKEILPVIGAIGGGALGIGAGAALVRNAKGGAVGGVIGGVGGVITGTLLADSTPGTRFETHMPAEFFHQGWQPWFIGLAGLAASIAFEVSTLAKQERVERAVDGFEDWKAWLSLRTLGLDYLQKNRHIGITESPSRPLTADQADGMERYITGREAAQIVRQTSDLRTLLAYPHRLADVVQPTVRGLVGSIYEAEIAAMDRSQAIAPSKGKKKVQQYIPNLRDYCASVPGTTKRASDILIGVKEIREYDPLAACMLLFPSLPLVMQTAEISGDTKYDVDLVHGGQERGMLAHYGGAVPMIKAWRVGFETGIQESHTQRFIADTFAALNKAYDKRVKIGKYANIAGFLPVPMRVGAFVSAAYEGGILSEPGVTEGKKGFVDHVSKAVEAASAEHPLVALVALADCEQAIIAVHQGLFPFNAGERRTIGITLGETRAAILQTLLQKAIPSTSEGLTRTIIQNEAASSLGVLVNAAIDLAVTPNELYEIAAQIRRINQFDFRNLAQSVLQSGVFWEGRQYSVSLIDAMNAVRARERQVNSQLNSAGNPRTLIRRQDATTVADLQSRTRRELYDLLGNTCQTIAVEGVWNTSLTSGLPFTQESLQWSRLFVPYFLQSLEWNSVPVTRQLLRDITITLQKNTRLMQAHLSVRSTEHDRAYTRCLALYGIAVELSFDETVMQRLTKDERAQFNDSLNVFTQRFDALTGGDINEVYARTTGGSSGVHIGVSNR